LAFDSVGNLFVATTFCDATCHPTIFKITPDGVQTVFGTIAGDSFLEGLAIDRSDNVFALITAGIIYKFTPTGIQSMFGSVPVPPLNTEQSFGLAFDSAGNLFALANFSVAASQIWKFLPDGTRSLFATASSALYAFADCAFDRFGNLFVSTQGSCGQEADTILKYLPDGTESTFATGLNHPFGLAFDNAGNLFVAEQYTAPNCTLPGDILKFTPAAIRSVFASAIGHRLEWLAFRPRRTP
jgi:sugar lactone lactonase YvrE